jgi:hypothetical protein
MEEDFTLWVRSERAGAGWVATVKCLRTPGQEEKATAFDLTRDAAIMGAVRELLDREASS